MTSGTATIDSIAYPSSGSYDDLDRPTTATFPKRDPTNASETAETLSFGYSARTLLSQLTSSAGTTYLSGITYNELGQPLTAQNGAGITTTRAYDDTSGSNGATFRLTDLTFSGTGAPVLAYHYTWDNVGNLRTLTENATNVTQFAYDELHRLTSATNAGGSGYVASYSYDATGDLLTKTEGASHTLAYTGSDPKHAPKTVDGVTYQYES